VKFCMLSRLRWVGHIVRYDDDDLSRTVLISEPGEKRLRETQTALGRWIEGICSKAGV
jgi:hypothetical protein